MGLFSSKVPNTISDDVWGKIRKGAEREVARNGGIFGKKATEGRKAHSKILAQSKKGRN